MTAPICPETGTPMKRGVAPLTISYKDQSVAFEMSGWYCDECNESIHTGAESECLRPDAEPAQGSAKNQRAV